MESKHKVKGQFFFSIQHTWEHEHLKHTLLMYFASFRRCPSAAVFHTFSEPAKSTRYL